MKKSFCKVLAFMLIFILVFHAVQGILHYRWTGDEDLYTRNILYKNEPENSIDVLYFGTSEIYAGVFPTAIYHKAGITSFNFAISYKSAITTYYQLEYALKTQTPDLVMCDFAALFSDSLPNNNEAIYRKVVDTMPDYHVKYNLIKDLCAEDDTQSALSYYFPLLRYHSMWNDLNSENFEKDYIYDTEYGQYKQGCLLSNADYNEDYDGQVYKIAPELWQVESKDSELSSVSVKYYDKMIELCNNRGIKMVALIPPRISGASIKAAQWGVTKDYLESRDVDIIDYNTYEAVSELNLVLEEDYYNAGHLNYKGAVKLSEDLAVKLSQKYNLADHREDIGNKKFFVWNSYWDMFTSEYQYQ